MTSEQTYYNFEARIDKELDAETAAEVERECGVEVYYAKGRYKLRGGTLGQIQLAIHKLNSINKELSSHVEVYGFNATQWEQIRLSCNYDKPDLIQTRVNDAFSSVQATLNRSWINNYSFFSKVLVDIEEKASVEIFICNGNYVFKGNSLDQLETVKKILWENRNGRPKEDQQVRTLKRPTLDLAQPGQSDEENTATARETCTEDETQELLCDSNFDVGDNQKCGSGWCADCVHDESGTSTCQSKSTENEVERVTQSDDCDSQQTTSAGNASPASDYDNDKQRHRFDKDNGTHSSRLTYDDIKGSTEGQSSRLGAIQNRKSKESSVDGDQGDCEVSTVHSRSSDDQVSAESRLSHDRPATNTFESDKPVQPDSATVPKYDHYDKESASSTTGSRSPQVQEQVGENNTDSNKSQSATDRSAQPKRPGRRKRQQNGCTGNDASGSATTQTAEGTAASIPAAPCRDTTASAGDSRKPNGRSEGPPNNSPALSTPERDNTDAQATQF